MKRITIELTVDEGCETCREALAFYDPEGKDFPFPWAEFEDQTILMLRPDYNARSKEGRGGHLTHWHLETVLRKDEGSPAREAALERALAEAERGLTFHDVQRVRRLARGEDAEKCCSGDATLDDHEAGCKNFKGREII